MCGDEEDGEESPFLDSVANTWVNSEEPKILNFVCAWRNEVGRIATNAGVRNLPSILIKGLGLPQQLARNHRNTTLAFFCSRNVAVICSVVIHWQHCSFLGRCGMLWGFLGYSGTLRERVNL